MLDLCYFIEMRRKLKNESIGSLGISPSFTMLQRLPSMTTHHRVRMWWRGLEGTSAQRLGRAPGPLLLRLLICLTKRPRTSTPETPQVSSCP